MTKRWIACALLLGAFLLSGSQAVAQVSAQLRDQVMRQTALYGTTGDLGARRTSSQPASWMTQKRRKSSSVPRPRMRWLGQHFRLKGRGSVLARRYSFSKTSRRASPHIMLMQYGMNLLSGRTSKYFRKISQCHRPNHANSLSQDR